MVRLLNHRRISSESGIINKIWKSTVINVINVKHVNYEPLFSASSPTINVHARQFKFHVNWDQFIIDVQHVNLSRTKLMFTLLIDLDTIEMTTVLCNDALQLRR